MNPRVLEAIIPVMLAILTSSSGCFLFDDNAFGSLGGPEDPEGEPSGESLEPSGESRPRVRVDVEACSQGLSALQIQDNLAIAYDLEAALIELERGAADIAFLSRRLMNESSQLLLDPQAQLLPETHEYEPEAVTYVRKRNELGERDRPQLEVSFALVDEPIIGNLFELSSYLLDAQITVAEPGSETAITHAGLGPLGEMLKRGPEPPSPLVFQDADELGLEISLHALSVQGHAILEELAGARSALAYEVQIHAGRAIEPFPIDFELVSARGERDDLNQELVFHSWDIHAVDNETGIQNFDLIGYVQITASGGRFDFVARYEWEGDLEPRIAITCAN